MRIIQVVPSVEREASGPSYSVPRLALALAERGNDVQLMSVGGQALQFGPSLRHTTYRRNLGQIQLFSSLHLSRELEIALEEQINTADLVHIHGMWAMPTVYPARAARRAGKPFLISPRGSFSSVALARSRWRKWVFWQLMQGAHVRRATCLHATSEQEYRDIRAVGLTQPVTFIPNGIDVCPIKRNALMRGGRRRLLYLGRLHPIKGLENLLAAWRVVSRKFSDWELRLVGPGEPQYVAKLKRLCMSEAIERVNFVGARFGTDKEDEYVAADLFVLPSFSENFGMSVAESLAAGTPAITTTAMPWLDIAERGCGWSVAPDQTGIERALFEALAKSSRELEQMGERGKTWMMNEFSWLHIAAEMENVYRWLLRIDPAPNSVRAN